MEYLALYKVMGYHFDDAVLCEQALVHRSLSKQSNERLEFLGDSILGFVIADELYRRNPTMAEGELSRLRSNLVNGDLLADIALELGLDEYLKLGQGEEQSGGRQRRSILADVVEAMIAAIYLDAGLDVCRQCVLRWFDDRLSTVVNASVIKDAKSLLQEWTQAEKYSLPVYEIIQVTGQAHQQTFEVSCRVQELDFEAIGISSSRRRAEQAAAQQFLEKLREQ